MYIDFMPWFVIDMDVGFDKLKLVIITQSNDDYINGWF